MIRAAQLIKTGRISIQQALDRLRKNTSTAIDAVAVELGKAKVSVNDTTLDYLLSKLVGGTNINLVELNDGGNEQIRIDATGAAADVWVKATGADTTADYLDNKVVPGDGLIRTIANPGLNEQYQLDVVANADGSIQVNANDIQVGVLATDGQHGSRGGGALHTGATGAVNGFMSASDKLKLDGIVPANLVPTSRNLTAGDGLTGGGDLTADRTFDVVANADGSIQVNANDVQVGVLATDGQHGNRGGGALHAVATQAVAGFMSASDKTTLDGLVVGGSGITAEGGLYITAINDTGEVSVKGKVVRASTAVDHAVSLANLGELDPMGVIYDAGVAISGSMRVVIAGWADVLVDAGSTIQREYWVGAPPSPGGTIGRASVTTIPSPPTATTHFQEIGHCFETKANTGNTLARCVLHFN